MEHTLIAILNTLISAKKSGIFFYVIRSDEVIVVSE